MNILGLQSFGLFGTGTGGPVSSAAFTLFSIDQAVATFGEQVVLTGENLGSSSGALFFVDENGGYHVITTDAWTDVSISATVPAIAALAGLCTVVAVSAGGDDSDSLVDALEIYVNATVSAAEVSAADIVQIPVIYETSEDTSFTLSAAVSADTILYEPTVSADQEFCDWTTFSLLPQPDGTLNLGSPMYDKERLLYDSLVSEGYLRYGISMTFFVVSYNTSADKVWGEDNARTVVRQFPFKGYCEMPSEDRTLARYGIEDMDNLTVYSARRHFAVASTLGHSGVVGNKGIGTYAAYTPKVGDLIKIDPTNILYEVRFVNEHGAAADGMFLQSAHVWEMVVGPYRDRHHTLSPATSATLSPLDVQNDRVDERDVTQTISTRKTAVLYAPKSNEKPVNDPFAGW
jgi:hypothetical protein